MKSLCAFLQLFKSFPRAEKFSKHGKGYHFYSWGSGLGPSQTRHFCSRYCDIAMNRYCDKNIFLNHGFQDNRVQKYLVCIDSYTDIEPVILYAINECQNPDIFSFHICWGFRRLLTNEKTSVRTKKQMKGVD